MALLNNRSQPVAAWMKPQSLWQWRFIIIAVILLSITFLSSHHHTSSSIREALSSLGRPSHDNHAESHEYAPPPSIPPTPYTPPTPPPPPTPPSSTSAPSPSTPTPSATSTVSDTAAKPSPSSGEQVWHEGETELRSYVQPFVCDVPSLPKQVRLATVEPEHYVIMGHGFQDIVSDFVWRGGWEGHITQAMEAFMRAVTAVEPTRHGYMDLGTNIGAHALHFAARHYRVHMFEPTFANHLLVRCSLAMTGKNPFVRLNAFGVGDKPASVCMKFAEWNMGGSEINQTAHDCDFKQKAHIDTLDHYYNKFIKNQQKFGVVKMDIQGFEVHALNGGTQFWDSEEAPVAVFFEYDHLLIKNKGSRPRELVKYFLDRDYSIFQGNGRNKTAIPYEEFPEDKFVSGDGQDPDLVAISNKWKAKLEENGYYFEGSKLKGVPGF